jgi:hypothetical protein
MLSPSVRAGMAYKVRFTVIPITDIHFRRLLEFHVKTFTI